MSLSNTRSNSKLEDHPLSADRNVLFIISARMEAACQTHNLRIVQPVVTRTILSLKSLTICCFAIRQCWWTVRLYSFKSFWCTPRGPNGNRNRFLRLTMLHFFLKLQSFFIYRSLSCLLFHFPCFFLMQCLYYPLNAPSFLTDRLVAQPFYGLTGRSSWTELFW